MKSYLFIIAIVLIASCSQKKTEVVKDVVTKPKIVSVPVEKILFEYFKAHEITPIITLENTEGSEKVVKISTHKITWIDSENETKVKINQDLFSLKGKLTLNEVDGESQDDVDFANNWDEIKLYKFIDREIIGIRTCLKI